MKISPDTSTVFIVINWVGLQFLRVWSRDAAVYYYDRMYRDPRHKRRCGNQIELPFSAAEELIVSVILLYGC